MNFKRIGMVFALALISWLGLLGYTNIVAVSQGGTGATTASAARTNLGLGSIATQASDNVSITGGSVTGITDLAVADGGTGASTAAGARDNIVFASAGSVSCASPCTPGTGITVVTMSGTGTVNLPALSGYVDGRILRVVNDSSSTATITLDPSDSGTLDGGSAGASAQYTVLAHGVVGAVRTSETTWGSVQPGGLTANGLRWYVSGGTVYALPVNVNGSTVTDLGSAVAATTADPSSFAAVGSGADIVVPSGAVGISSALGANGQRWGWSLSALGLTAPATPFIGNTRLTVTSITGTRGGAAINLLAGFGTSATAPQRANGLYIGTTGTSNSYSILVSAGGGLPTNAVGAGTMTGCQNTQWYGTATTTTYWATRLDSGAPASYNTSGSAPSVSSTPTHFTLYLYVGTGTLTNAITYTSPTGLVWWTAPA